MTAKQYLKMVDVFPDGAPGFPAYWNDEKVKYAAHAINSHDELVEQNENMKLRINQLLSERNATGVAIENALNGILPDSHQMINRLQMIAGVAARNDELVAEVERLRELERDAMRYRFLRECHWNESPLCVVVDPKTMVKLGADCPTTTRLDDAIDAVMS